MRSFIYRNDFKQGKIKLQGPNNRYLFAASQKREPLKIFQQKNTTQKNISLQANYKTIMVHLMNGSTRKEEVYHGNSFL